MHFECFHNGSDICVWCSVCCTRFRISEFMETHTNKKYFIFPSRLFNVYSALATKQHIRVVTLAYFSEASPIWLPSKETCNKPLSLFLHWFCHIIIVLTFVGWDTQQAWEVDCQMGQNTQSWPTQMTQTSVSANNTIMLTYFFIFVSTHSIDTLGQILLFSICQK